MTQQTDIFTQYELFPDESSVKKVLTSNGLIQSSSLNPHKPLIKQYFQACIDNIEKRNLYSTFRGKLMYLAEIQNVYSYFRSIAPTLRASFEQYIWKNSKINISNKFQVQAQCNKCGDYISPFLTGCGLCLNYAYCNQQCHISHKYQHLSQCKRNPCPTISGGLPVEIHVGGHLQQNIQVKYNHSQKMSFKIKGRKVVQKLNTLIESSPQMQQSSKQKKSNDIVINNIEDIKKVYINSPALTNLRLILLRQGCIFQRMQCKDQNDNIHIILHYLYPI